jgi:hypothetical protein
MVDTQSFFTGVQQTMVKTDSISFRVPLFYQDMLSMGVFLLAPMKKVRKLLPSGRMHPYRVTPWHCIITITVTEYRETDVGPYNQVSIGIPFTMDRKSPVLTGILHKPPERPMIYLLHLPVTSDTARVTGLEMANYPEFMADITFDQEGQWTRCKAEADGKHILTLSGRKLDLTPTDKECVYPVTLQGDQLLRSEFSFSACESGTSKKPADVQLAFGSHPIGLELRELCRGVVAYQYWPRRQAVLSPVCGTEMLT